jgi:hypothetical protein
MSPLSLKLIPRHSSPNKERVKLLLSSHVNKSRWTKLQQQKLPEIHCYKQKPMKNKKLKTKEFLKSSANKKSLFQGKKKQMPKFLNNHKHLKPQ